jgi:hypothetical protein
MPAPIMRAGVPERPDVPEPRRSGNDTPVVAIDSHETFKPEPVTIEDIYHSPDLVGSPYLRNALLLISEALGVVDSAIELLADGDRVGADDAMQHYQVLLPQLFACRAIGEGFGLVASSLHNAVTRLRGEPMNEAQVRAVRSVLVALRSGPFLTFDAGMEQVSKLERASLNVDPPKFEYLAELLSE